MKPKMSAAPPSASQSEALHNQSDTCVQRCPKRYQTDCEEKRDPDERQRSLTIKENELDPNAQLEKLPFTNWSRCCVCSPLCGHSPRLRGQPLFRPHSQRTDAYLGIALRNDRCSCYGLLF